MRTHLFKYIALVLCPLALVACKRDMFDPSAYKTIIQESFPVENIDPAHNWNLTQSHSTVVNANVDATVNITQIRILNGNPYSTKKVEVLAETDASRGDTKTLSYYTPAYQKELYIAAVTDDGRHLLKTFNVDSQPTVELSDVQEYDTKINKPIYQTYTYLYETTYPEPGDWDFNDLVMRIQKLPAQSANEIRLEVTLEAVGCQKQVAAAIHLLNYSYDDIESVTTEDGRTFDGDLNIKRTFIEKPDLLLKGLHGEAIVNLFEDAHYALAAQLEAKEYGGNPKHIFYNTHRKPSGNTQAQVAAKRITYVIKLKNPQQAGNFSLEDIDPFAMEDFNSGRWEIHTFAHKSDQMLHDLGSNETAKSNNMSWALVIPSSTFRWPIEGESLGLYKEGILTGAYMKSGHSYAQWVRDHTICLDWFIYPTTGLVY